NDARANRRWRRKGRRHVEADQGWLLHHVAGRQAKLLPPHDRRRQQVVGDEGNHGGRDLGEVRPGGSESAGLLPRDRHLIRVSRTIRREAINPLWWDARPRAGWTGPKGSAASRSAWRGRRT